MSFDDWIKPEISTMSFFRVTVFPSAAPEELSRSLIPKYQPTKSEDL